MSLGIELTFFAVILLLAGGIYTLLVSKNLVRTLIAIEVMMKGVTLMLVLAGYFTHQLVKIQAVIISMIVVEVVVITVAAGIVISIYRNNGSLSSKSTETDEEG
ncbi:MAG: hypothetical protein BGN88_08240 [Clostridiales bacterium 43-6]|nr:MAG: hypothetical protein BGN88_08240 [Clostridiales bacterium 43-6]